MDSSRRRSNFSAYSKSTSPAGVNSTDFAERSSSLALYACSNWRICALTADWERNTFCPAREKLFSLATYTNVVSWSKSIVGLPDKIIRESSLPAVRIILSFRLVWPFAKLAQPVAAPGKIAGAAETGRERVSKSLPPNPENARAARASAARPRGRPAFALPADCAYDEHVLQALAAATPLLAVRSPQATQIRGAVRLRPRRAKRMPTHRSFRSRSSAPAVPK